MLKALYLKVLLCVLAISAAQAQRPDTSHIVDRHVHAFTNGDPAGWTFGAPHIDLAGGYYGATGNGATNGAAFFRGHVQLAVRSPYLQLSSDIQFVPKFTQASPTASLVLQVAPIRQHSPFYFSAGVGLITNHTASGAAAAWVQAQFAYRGPLHGFSLFTQIGRSLNTGSVTELLIGVQHPLAPYIAHGLKS